MLDLRSKYVRVFRPTQYPYVDEFLTKKYVNTDFDTGVQNMLAVLEVGVPN